MNLRQPACFVGHGVPSLLAFEGDPTRAWMGRFGATLRARSPKGIVCVSAHFVAPTFTVTTAESPTLEHDGETASLTSDYRPPGDVALSRRVLEHLLHARLKPVIDPARGLDHGAWLPLSLLFPEADVPIVQVSLHDSLDPDQHVALGRALRPLRDEGVVLVGSGSLTHDVRDLERLSRDATAPDVLGEPSRRFQAWATDILTGAAPYARARGLTRFRDHPDAHRVHTTGKHFLPLLVVAGAASPSSSEQSQGVLVHAGSQRGLSMAAFLFER